ncbi:MAG: 5'-methylthioadenosine/adenosylhomocysteine nucleosidase [Paraprevotella sp.]|nr:5'-methylthioadenosine/adenosylhomocysteine nucleosidase [Paraprevotella sp.]
MKIGILTAMDSEHDQLAALLENKEERVCGNSSYLCGTLGVHEIVLYACGIGKVNAAVGAVDLIRRFAPDCMVSTGVAGGIDTCLGVMDVVVSTQTVYHDMWCGPGNAYGQVQGMPERFEGCEKLWQTAQKLNTETRIHAGLICTGDKFITDRAELNTIKTAFPEGLAVDMESAAIAQTCYLLNVPFVSFRIISDTPGVEQHLEQWDNFWGEMADRSFGVTRTFLMSLPKSL